MWQVFLIDFRQKCSSIQAIFIWFNTFWLLLFVRRDRLFSYFSIDFDGNEIAGSARARSLCEHSFIVSCHQNYSFRVLVLPKINTISRRRIFVWASEKNKNKKCDCKSIDKRCLRWFWFFFFGLRRPASLPNIRKYVDIFRAHCLMMMMLLLLLRLLLIVFVVVVVIFHTRKKYIVCQC